MHSAGGQRDDPVPAHSFTLAAIYKNRKKWNQKFYKK